MTNNSNETQQEQQQQTSNTSGDTESQQPITSGPTRLTDFAYDSAPEALRKEKR